MTSKRVYIPIFVVSFLLTCLSVGLVVYRESVPGHTGGNWLDVVFIVSMLTAYYSALRLYT